MCGCSPVKEGWYPCSTVCCCVQICKALEWSDDERLFSLKLSALCPKATEFDGGGVRSSVGQNKARGPQYGAASAVWKRESVTVDTRCLRLLFFRFWNEQSIFHLFIHVRNDLPWPHVVCYSMQQEACRSSPRWPPNALAHTPPSFLEFKCRF